MNSGSNRAFAVIVVFGAAAAAFGVAADAQSENRPVKIFKGASGVIESYGGAAAAAAPATAADGGRAACSALTAVSNVTYNAEEIVYDLSEAAAFETQSKIISEFELTRTVAYATTAKGECAGAVSITFDLSPIIHLPATLDTDGSGCKRLAQIERERAFGQITLAAYRQLGKEIEQRAIEAFKVNKPATADDAVAAMETETAGSGLLNAFDAAQKIRRRNYLASQNAVGTYDDCSASGAESELKVKPDVGTGAAGDAPVSAVNSASGRMKAPITPRSY